MSTEDTEGARTLVDEIYHPDFDTDTEVLQLGSANEVNFLKTVSGAYQRDREHGVPVGELPAESRLFRIVVVELVSALRALQFTQSMLKDETRARKALATVVKSLQKQTREIMEIAFAPDAEDDETLRFKAMDLLFVLKPKPDTAMTARHAGALMKLLTVEGQEAYEASSVMHYEDACEWEWVSGVLLDLDQEDLIDHFDSIVELAGVQDYYNWERESLIEVARYTALELLKKLPTAMIAKTARLLLDLLLDPEFCGDSYYSDGAPELATQMLKSLDSATLAATFFGNEETRRAYYDICLFFIEYEKVCEILAMIEPDDLKKHMPAFIECLDIESESGSELAASAVYRKRECTTPVLKLLSRFEPADLLAHAPAFEAFLRRDDIDEDHECRALAKEILGAIFEPGAPGSAAARAEFDLAASAVPAASAG